MLMGRRWQGKNVILLFFIVFLHKGPLLSAFTPISKAHFTFLLQQLQHEGPSGRDSRGRNFREDCGQEGGVCGHYGQVEDIMWTVHTILFMFSLYSLYIFISAIYVLALEFLYSQCCLFRIGSVLPLIDIFT